VDDAVGQLRAAIVTAMAAGIGASDVAFLDMAANQGVLSDRLKAAVAPVFLNYGLELTQFFLQSLSLPEDVQDHLDRKSSMRIVGDLASYTQFEAAESLRDAAANPGGVAGAGVGLGAGFALAQTMGAALQPASAPAASPIAAPAASPIAASAASPIAAPAAATAAATEIDPVAMIEKLGELFQKGILTQAEFDAKKAELLQKIR
jgi:membrane protease subunit (stomatin/prohibitin family)